jgi:hypothetical protein
LPSVAFSVPSPASQVPTEAQIAASGAQSSFEPISPSTDPLPQTNQNRLQSMNFGAQIQGGRLQANMRQLPGFQNMGLGGQMQQQLGLGGMTQGLGSFGEMAMKLR